MDMGVVTGVGTGTGLSMGTGVLPLTNGGQGRDPPDCQEEEVESTTLSMRRIFLFISASPLLNIALLER